MIHHYRSGAAWRDLPAEYGPWQTVWKRHKRFAVDGTWQRVLAVLLEQAAAAGLICWEVSVDSTITRAHQHATTLPRAEPGTGGRVESQEIAAGAA